MVRRETYLTSEGRVELEEELHRLMIVRRGEVAKRIHLAAESGGTVDNAEYDETKNEQAFVEGRISKLEIILSSAVVASSSELTRGSVEFGSTVTVRTEAGRKQLFKVVGSAEALPLKGKISIESPVGQALLGHKVGDKVDVETPSGVVRLTVLKVS